MVESHKKGYYVLWLGLTKTNIIKYLEKFFLNKRTYDATKPETRQYKIRIIATIYGTRNLSYSDQAGQFPVTSNRVNNYIFLFRYYYLNYIKVELLKSKADREFQQTIKKVHHFFSTKV